MSQTGIPSFETLRRMIPADWCDRNGHMNEGRYGQVFSDAADTALDRLGAGAVYIAGGHSYFTVEALTRFLAETRCGEEIFVTTRVAGAEGKKLRLVHEMRRTGSEEKLATCDQLLLHVDLRSRRSCAPLPELRARLAAFAPPG